MTETLELPQLSGGRKRADLVVEPIRDQLRDAVIVLDCRQLVAGTSSFADEFVKQVLVVGGARQLSVQHGDRTSDFYQYLLDAARDHGVGDKLVID